MKIFNFLSDSLYQLVTWVFIALSIGGFFYFLSKGNARGVLWSVVGLLGAIVVMIGILADNYFFRTGVESSNSQRPYVFFKETRLLTPLVMGQMSEISFILKNGGQLETKGFFKNMTFCITLDREAKCFVYRDRKQVPFTLAPGDEVRVQLRPNFEITQKQIEELNSRDARLTVFARGEFSGPNGQLYPLALCRMYNPQIAGNFVFCDERGTAIEMAVEDQARKKEESEPSPQK